MSAKKPGKIAASNHYNVRPRNYRDVTQVTVPGCDFPAASVAASEPVILIQLIRGPASSRITHDQENFPAGKVVGNPC